MKKFNSYWTVFLMLVGAAGCASHPVNNVSNEQAAKLDRQLVKDAVVYEPGTQEGAVVPEISAPRLRASFVPEHVEGSRLIEGHREWVLEGDVSILGIPRKGYKQK